MFSNEDKDISIELSCLLLKISGFWLAANRVERFCRKIALTYTVATISFAIYVDSMDIYYTWGDFGNIAYMSCNILCILMVVVKVIVLFIRRAEFKELIIYTQRNFWHSNYDPYEKKLIANCRKFYTICVIFIYMVTQATLGSYVLTPVLANLERNKSDRVLPFNMWIDLPLNVTPYYEIFFTVQILAVYQVGVCYVSFDNFLCLLNTHVACQFRILQYRIMNLCSANINKETNLIDYTNQCYITLKNCVRQHQALIEYCRKLEYVFTLVIFAHMLAFSLLLCLMGYQILLADSSPARRSIFIFHVFGSFVQLILYTYGCDSLKEESANIGTAVYSVPWTFFPMCRIGRMFRNDLKMIILRSSHPCCLTAGGFFPVSLETSTTVLSTALSYFTLMKESSVQFQE